MEKTTCYGNSTVTCPTETSSNTSRKIPSRKVLANFALAFANTALSEVMRRVIMDLRI